MKQAACFIQLIASKASGAGVDKPFFSQLSRAHSRLSTSPAPWWCGALVHPFRGPPDLRFPPKRSTLPSSIFPGSSRKMQSLASRRYYLLRVPGEKARQKRRVKSCTRTAFPLSASSATKFN